MEYTPTEVLEWNLGITVTHIHVWRISSSSTYGWNIFL